MYFEASSTQELGHKQVLNGIETDVGMSVANKVQKKSVDFITAPCTRHHTQPPYHHTQPPYHHTQPPYHEAGEIDIFTLFVGTCMHVYVGRCMVL